MLFSDFSGGNQRPHRGRSAGPNFSPMRNWGKNRLGRSPLRTSLGYEAVPASSLGSARHPCCGPCLCHHTRLPWAAGPMAGWFPPPGLPCPSGVPAAGHHHRTIGPAFFIIHYSFFIHHYSTSIFNSSTLRDGFRAKLTAYPSTRDKSATRLSTSRGVTNSSRPGASSGARSPSRS